MKSPGFGERFSLPKLLAALLSFLLVFIAGSCSNEQTGRMQNELPDDRDITEAIRSQYEVSDEIPADSLQIQVDEGVVTLNGTTSNLLAKKTATEIAESAYGVLSVVNNLKITTSRPDAAVKEDVERALATDPATETWDIATEVGNGAVTLTGRADSWQERRLAGTIASRVKGVKQVNNNIILNPSADRSDEEIRTEIEQTLKMSTRIRSGMVDVAVDSGIVTLSGAIGSARQKTVAEELAHVTGVEAVETDLLEVHPEYDSKLFRNQAIEQLTAAEVREAIENALRYDPRVPQDSISVTIDGNIAILEGSVENLNSKLAAGEDARHTAGVTTVQNDIAVERVVVVTPDIPTTDEAIEERVRYAILRDPYVEELNDITVSVDNGVAVLGGEVDTEFEKEQVRRIIENVKGITAIRNDLAVNTQRNG